MADILAVAMLVAVAIALEDVAPSGQVSIEHIENVLARLNSPLRLHGMTTRVDSSQRLLLRDVRKSA